MFSKAFWAIEPLWKPRWVLAEEDKRSLLCIVHCTIVCHTRDILQVCAGLCSLTRASCLFVSLLWQSIHFLHVLSAMFDDFLYLVYTNKSGISSFSQILVCILADTFLCFLYSFLPVYFYSIIDEDTWATKSSSSLNIFCWLVCLCVFCMLCTWNIKFFNFFLCKGQTQNLILVKQVLCYWATSKSSWLFLDMKLFIIIIVAEHVYTLICIHMYIYTQTIPLL